MKGESLNTPIQSPQFQSRSGMLNHTGGTYSHSGVVDYPGASIAEMNLGKFPDPMEFQSWKTNFRAEVCLETSALKKILNTQVPFRQRVSVEEQRAQIHHRILRGRQIAYMIYEFFRATGAYETAQGLADLFTMSLQALLSVSEMPSNIIMEALCKSKLVSSVQLQTVTALYDQEFARNNGEPNCQQF